MDLSELISNQLILLILDHQLLGTFLCGGVGKVAKLDAVLPGEADDVAILGVGDAVVLDPDNISVADDFRTEAVNGCVDVLDRRQHGTEDFEEGVVAAEDHSAFPGFVGVFDLPCGLFPDFVFLIEN